MRRSSPLHTCIAAFLLVAMFCSMTLGRIAPQKIQNQDSPVFSQLEGECSFTAGNGCSSRRQQVESAPHDHNPSCCHRTEMPAYSPDVTCLAYAPEPLATAPRVYYDKFVPPRLIG